MTKTINDTIIKIPKFINKLAGLNRTDRECLAQLDYLNNEDGCTATNKHLGSYLDKHHRTIQTIIAKLRDLGHITVKIISRYKRIITTNFEKLSKPLQKPSPDQQEGTAKQRTRYGETPPYITSKSNKKSLCKKSLNMYQGNKETIAEFEARCDQRNQLGDVNIIKGYNKRNNNYSKPIASANIDNNTDNTTNSTNMIQRMKAQMIAGKNKVLRELHSMKQIKYVR
jgi:hypothetical protein